MMLKLHLKGFRVSGIAAFISKFIAIIKYNLMCQNMKIAGLNPKILLPPMAHTGGIEL